MGAGHAHAFVLEAFAKQPEPGIAITVVSDSPLAAYSGSVPAWLAGECTLRETQIDIAALCQRANARLILSPANTVNTRERNVALANGERWDVRYRDEDLTGVPWLANWSQSPSVTSDVDFGSQAGQTPAGQARAYLDLGTLALRLGQTIWLIVTNSVISTTAPTTFVAFDWPGTVTVLTPVNDSLLGAVTYTPPSGSSITHEFNFDGIDALVLRLTS